jgi:DNA repair photolyase
MTQTSFLFDPHALSGQRTLLQVGEQKDIRYFAARSRSVLNGPKATGMGFWSLNPYVGCAFGCAYCYARYAHRYTAERLAHSPRSDDGVLPTDDLPPWLAFERRILVKREAGGLLRRALTRPATLEALREDRVVIGTATDPYQPAERRFRVTRGVLEVLAEQTGIGVTIITKSPLITRDIDLLTRIHERSSLSIHVSLITVDRELARRLEPRAPTPEARLRGMARLRAAGFEIGVNIMPVLPGITDKPEMVHAVVKAVKEAGVSYVGACALRLQATARARYLPFIDAEFPELAVRYRRAYAKGYQVSATYRDGLRTQFRKVCTEHGVVFGSPRYDDPDTSDGVQSAPVSPQLSLLL